MAERGAFLNWVNGHGGSILYSSGKKTTGRVSVRIPDIGKLCGRLAEQILPPHTEEIVSANFNSGASCRD